MRTYVAERQIEYWTSRQIEQFLFLQGYECLVYPVSPRLEKKLPADFIFSAGPVKLFGLQYKVLYHNGGDCWLLDGTQHATLQHFPWIYYGLSDIKRTIDFRNSLHALRIKANSFSFSPKFDSASTHPYMRWWAFYQGLLSCQFGARLEKPADLPRVLAPPEANIEIGQIAEIVDLYLISLNSPRAIHLINRESSPDDIWHVPPEE